MLVTLNPDEIALLFEQDPTTKADGGFQGLFVSLQNACDQSTGELELSDDHLRRIPQYAFYRNGGVWNGRLLGIFQRTLGENLGRSATE
jgi:hypothetical protein